MRLIDADELQIEIDSLSRLAQADAQKLLLGRVFYIIDHMPAIPAPQWISVEDRMPNKYKLVIITDGEHVEEGYINNYGIWSFGNGLRWETSLKAVTHWMPLPEPPDKRYKCRYADDNGVCSKLSGNGEIIYCMEGPCPYDFPEEVRDDGAHIEP